MNAVVTVIGKDRPGIIAHVSGALYKANANILDISQTVMHEQLFTMIMLVDIEKMSVSFGEFKESMLACGQELGLDVQVQRQEILTRCTEYRGRLWRTSIHERF